LSASTPFREPGEVFLDQQARKRTVTNLLRRLGNLDYEVTLSPKPA
jgi:hypothetical protein